MKIHVSFVIVVLVVVAAVSCGGCRPAASPSSGNAYSPGGDGKSSAGSTGGPLPVLGRVFEFGGRHRDGAAFHSAELAGFVWIGVLMDEHIAMSPAVASFFTMAEAVRTHPQLREIRLVGIRPELPAGQLRPPLPLVQEWTMVDVDPSVVARWRQEFQPSGGAASTEKQDSAESTGDAALVEQALIRARLVLVDGAGQIRGKHYDLTLDSIPLMLKDMHGLFSERKGVPPAIFDPQWLVERQKAQRENSGSFRVFHDFQFADRRIESGIRFRNKIVDDAGRAYLAGHYDHGNGVAVADVDLDGLEDIYFVNQVGGSELWRNRGGGEFEDVTAPAGLALPDRIGVTASFADIDNDGDADLYVTTTRSGNALFENDGTGRFRDISRQSGTDYVGHSSGAVFFDFDRDGLLDLFLCNVGRFTTEEKRRVTMETLRDEPQREIFYYRSVTDAFASHLKPDRAERSLLFRNTGNNVFRDVTEEVGLVDESWCGDALPVDFNGDGWQDLYLVNMEGNDEYYENQSGKSFVRRSREVFPRTPWGSMGIKAFDLENDGDLDLYITDMHSDMSEQIAPDREKLKADMKFPESFLQTAGQSIFGNAFFRNEGMGRFSEISDEIGAENYWPWGLSVGDLNADGFEDVFVASSMNMPFRYGFNSVLLNEGGKRLLDAEFVLGVEPRRGWRTAIPWYQVDCDGADRNHLDCKGRSGTIPVWSALGSRSSVIFDLDEDGDLDIVTNDFNSEPLVLVSSLADQKQDLSYLKVRLQGTKSSRQGLGAVVRVKLRDMTLTQVYDGKSGYMSQSSLALYFGLGQTAEVEEVQVNWPSGHRQIVSAPISLNSLLLIVESQE